MVFWSLLEKKSNKNVVLTEEKMDEIESKPETIWHIWHSLMLHVKHKLPFFWETVVNCKEVMWHNMFME